MILPLMRLPMFFPGQMGVPGSEVSLGIRQGTGNVYFVGVTGGDVTASDGNSGVDPMNPKATLAGAVAEVVAGRGDIIVVLPGTYSNQVLVTLTKPVKIFGYDYLTGGMSEESTFVSSANNILSIQTDKVEIAGLTFNAAGAAIVGITAAVTDNIAGLHIHHCRFLSGLAGIQLGTGSKVPSRFVIEDNVFSVIVNTAGNCGISVLRGSNGVIRRNVFSANVANAAHGIKVANVTTPNVLIADNDFTMVTAGNFGISRAGTTVDVAMHRNYFSGGLTPITVLVDGGLFAVANYQTDSAGGKLVDATT